MVTDGWKMCVAMHGCLAVFSMNGTLTRVYEQTLTIPESRRRKQNA